ncbi:unnamed protein product [Parajaminaea phylloscopi]
MLSRCSTRIASCSPRSTSVLYPQHLLAISTTHYRAMSSRTPPPELPEPSSGAAPRFQLPTVPGHLDSHDNVAKLRAVGRDFRSDTVTIPTDSMFAAMSRASRGDDVNTEDETTNSLQASMAALTGKEASLLVMSGTAGNQLALRTHLTAPPYSVLLDHRAHIHTNEAGGLALLSGATSLAIPPKNGRHLTWDDDVAPNLITDTDNVHYCPTRVICLENTLWGSVFPQEEILKISSEARKRGIIMHLDGARLWNVAAKTGKSMKELCEPFDTVSLCLSKGLGAPIGSIVVGPEAFIKRARHFRKLLGGGVRQVGPIAAAARVAIEEHFPLLPHTHALALWLQDSLEALGVRITQRADTNMLFIDTQPLGFSCDELKSRLASLDPPILSWAPRIVVHHQISSAAVGDFVDVVAALKQEVEKHGKVAVEGSARSIKGIYDR